MNNGKSKTPITAAQSKKKNGEAGGTKAQASQQASKRKNKNEVKQAVLDRISDGILAFDAGLNYTYLNERAGELLGRSAEELIGKNLQEEFSSVERTPFMEACQRALETRSIVWLNEYFPPTGRWLEGRIYPSEDGVSVVFAEGTARKAGESYGGLVDASESKQAEERLREISMFPEQNPNPVMRLTRQGEILYANQASAPLLASWKEQDNQAASFLKIRELLTVALENGSNPEVEIENQGRVFACLLVPFPAHEYVNLYFRDITGHKQAEEALRAIFNQAGAGITRTDLQGRFTFVNQAFCDMLGYSKSDLTGMSLWDISEGDIVEKSRRPFEHLLVTGEGYQQEMRLVRRNGSTLWASVGGSPLQDTEGRTVGATAVIVDITRRKRAEASLLDTARRSLFLSSLSDTIRSIDAPSKIRVEAACLLGAHLKASRVVYAEVDPGGMFLFKEGYLDGVPQMAGESLLADFIPQDQLVKFQSGRPVITPHVQNDPRFSDSQRSAHEKLSIQAQIILPFSRENKVIAALLVQQDRPRAWKEEEASLVEEAAERMQAAIERARAEGRLRDSEKRFRILSNTVPSIVWTAAPDGQLRYVNDRWYDFTGQPHRQEMLLWTDIKLHPDDAQGFFQQLRGIISAREEAVVEVRLQQKDGAYRWFQSRSVPTIDENGTITAWHGVLTDIHDRVEQDAEQRKIIDSTPFMLTRCSRDLRYQFVSRAYAEMIGTTPEEVTGRPIVDILGEEGLETILPYVERVLQGERVEYESNVPIMFGGTPYLHVAYTPDRDEQGNVAGWFASIVDLTERREMEESLRESEQKFNIVFNKLPFTALLLRPDDNVIVDINQEFETVFGYTRQEAIGKTTFDLGIDSRPEDRAYILAELQANVAIRDMEIQFNTKSHGPRTFLVNTDMVNIGGSQYILQTAQDITERKQIQQSLAHEREMFKRLFETMPVMSTIYEPETGTMRMNAEIERLTGWKVEEVTVVSLLQALYPDPDYMKEVLGRMAAAVTTKEWVEVKIHTRDGRILDTLWANISLMDGEKIITGISLGIDITERKRAEQELAEFARQQQALYHLADELSSSGSLEEMFNPALNAILNALQCDRASILLFDSQDVMSFVAWRGLSEEYRRATNGHSPWTRAEKNAHPISMEDIATADLSESLRAAIQAEGIGALAFIPLVTHGRLIGKFMVYFNTPHLFGEVEVGLTQTIAHQLASHIERRQAVEELRKSRQRLSLTYQHAPIGIVETTLDGHFLEVNDEFSRMLGYSHDDLLRLGIADITHQEDLETELDLYRQLVTGAVPFYRLEKRYIRKDGSLLWGEVVRTILHTEQGKALYGIGAVLNITERKQKAEELRARTEEIEALMEVSPIGIFVAHDPECATITGNPAGYGLVEMPGDSSGNISKSAPEEERPTYRTFRNGVELAAEELPMQAAARLGMEVEEETLELRFENGARKYIYAYAKPLFDARGGVRGAIAAMLDITESRRNEQALRESEERFARFMLHLPGLAWIKDIQGRYVFANAAAEKAFNISLEELYEKTDKEIFPQDVAAQFNRNDDLAVMEERSVQVVETLPQVDGVVHHSLVTKFPIPGPDGRPAMIGGTAFDITERVQMEEALRVARSQAEKTAYRMTQLQKLTAALSQAVTSSEIARMVVEQGAPVVGAVGSSILLLDEETQTLEMVYTSMDENIARPYRRFPLSLEVPTSDAVRTGQPVWIESGEEYLQRYPHLAGQIQEWGNEAALVFPMVYQGRVLGTLSLSFSRPMPFSSEDQEYLMTLARQAAQAFERARIETALRLDAAMMENVPAGIYLVRAVDGTILHTNPQLDKVFGYEPREIIGKPVSILNASNGHSAQVVAAEIIDILKREGSWQGEVLSLRKNGTSFWCHASITTFEHDTHGTVWVAARQDITERKQIEAALRESEQRYRAIVSQATAGIVRKDENGHLLFVNQAFCDLLGMSESELKGRQIWELTHPEDVGENKRLYNRLMVEGIPFHLEKRMVHKSGSVLWVSVSVSPVVDSIGKPHAAVSVYVDITGRKQAENRLALLAQVSELAREFEDPDELMFAVSRVVGEHFQARRTLFNEIDLENDRETIHHDYCRGVESVAGVHTISAYSSITTAEMMLGKTIVNYDSKLDPRTAGEYERSYVKYGERSYVSVPLMHEERWVASLWISDDKPREWDRDEVSMLETIAERTWIAIEKLRVDRALRDSEERLRVTFNTTAVGFATLTPATNFIDVNDAFCQIVGYSREELLELEFVQLIHPRFSESTREQVALLIAGTIPSFAIEKIFLHRDGTEIWVQNSISLVQDAEGEPSHLIVICQGITERKRAEESLHQLNIELEERVRKRTIELQVANEFLRESEVTSRLILESMPDAIVIIDRDGQIVHANTQVETLFGYSPGEVMGQPVETLIPQRFHTQHQQHRLSYGEQRNRRIMGLGHEFSGRRKDESEFPVEVMLAPIDNSTNWDVLVAIRDNTRQRQAQEALRTNEEKLRTLFEILPVGISFLDKEGRISELNSALTEILDLPRNQILAGNYKARRFIRADGTPMPASELASTRARLEQKTIYNVETGIVKDNGEIIWTSVNAAPVRVADVEAVIVTIDVTERKKAEEALHRNRERLRILSRRLVEVQEEERHAIARELHDRVGQNLAALTLNLNILRNQLSGETLEKVGTRLNDSVTLVNDILAITRSVMADLRPNVLDDYGLDAAINEYAERFTQHYGIRVVTHTPAKPTPRLDPGVEMTLLRIAQAALTNIARHAQATQAVMTIEMEEDAVLMTIEDNGQGILSWQKVNQPGSHGLTIMRERAEAFGGSLKINSTYRNGTTIEVKIPLAGSVQGNGRKEKKS